MSTEAEHNRRGLMKLMLKMPALRGKLQVTSASNADMFSLCGAFEEASSMLDRLRRQGERASPAVLREYESLCDEIQQEIIDICSR
jgi:hypothetical protein